MIVIPCFNEEQRLPTNDIMTLANLPGVTLKLVNDGSSDGTLALLHSLAETAPNQNIQVHSLPGNRGKGEAVRLGMLAGLYQKFDIVGYVDADMAVPASEVERLVSIVRTDKAKVLMGSRVAMLGHEIIRQPLRHYLGRIFATIASMILKVQVYDTQCGAKFFHNSKALSTAIQSPFISRWAFDVELIGRLLSRSLNPTALDVHEFLEVPLLSWHDRAGSKLGYKQMTRAALDLFLIWKNFNGRK